MFWAYLKVGNFKGECFDKSYYKSASIAGLIREWFDILIKVEFGSCLISLFQSAILLPEQKNVNLTVPVIE